MGAICSLIEHDGDVAPGRRSHVAFLCLEMGHRPHPTFHFELYRHTT